MYLEELEEKTKVLVENEIDLQIKEKLDQIIENKSDNMFKFDPDDVISTKYMLFNYSDIFTEEDLVQLLFNEDLYISFKAAFILTKIYKYKEHRKEYFAFFRHMFKENTNYDESNQLLEFLVDFISYKSSENYDIRQRKLELVQNRTLTDILNTLIFVKDVQYNILLIIYILSFEDECIKYMDTLINEMLQIIKDKPREKILRVCYATLVNLFNAKLSFPPSKMFEIAKLTDQFLEVEHGDEELIEDLNKVKEITSITNKSICIQDYLNELFTGRFEDSDYHHSNEFWSNNSEVLLKNKTEIVKALKKYLKSQNSKWVCLACNDIYHLIKILPEINPLLSKYQVRDVLLNLTNSNDDDIRFYALQSLYMCIFSEWG